MISKTHSRLGPRQVRPLHLTKCDNYRGLSAIGICFDAKVMRKMVSALDSSVLPATSTTASNAVPVQFLQTWLPGFVAALTTPRKIDTLIGVDTVGSWEDEEVVQPILELTGKAAVYGDYTNVPLSSWNVAFERRSIVRFEEGLQVGRLEELRSARMKIDTASTKRTSASMALEINRNSVGFYGYNNGTNRTYGMLNDPGLSAYKTVTTGASGKTTWADKTFMEITADIRLMAKDLRVTSKGLVAPEKDQCTFTLADGAVDYLSVTSEAGVSVYDWLKKTYPNWRTETAPEFDGANGGANIAQLNAEKVAADDASTDDLGVWSQLVPAKFFTLGSEKTAKAYLEDFSNATAGAMLKRPYACVRFTGM